MDEQTPGVVVNEAEQFAVFSSPAPYANRVIVNSTGLIVRLGFIEQIPVGDKMTPFSRGAISLHIVDAVGLRDALSSVIEQAEELIASATNQTS